MEPTTDSQLDPILVSVLANRFDAIVREMTNTLFRTGRSAILNTAKDFSCCIVTNDHNLLSAVDSLQIHVMGAGLQTPSIHEFHDDVCEGDAFLHNDPYLGNTHIADHTILVPVYVDGEHLFTSCAKAHQADCGNAQPTTYMPFAQDVYEEAGLVFPCVRIQKDYRDIDDIIRMCRSRIRVPDVWFGDYLATLGAARIGEKRLKELVARYGRETVVSFVREWLDYSERRMGHAISQLPAGELRASSCHDPLPGLPDGVPVNVTIRVKPEDEIIEVDLRDNVDCVPAGINLSEASSRTSAMIGVLNCVDSSVPRNGGSFRRINVLLRDNCVVGKPKFPASCSMATTNMTNRLINATQRAFSELGSEYGLAEGAASMGAGLGVISGKDARSNGDEYVNQILLSNNGGPASPVCDGWVTYGMPDCATTTLVDSIEICELKYPILVRSLHLLKDSGGAGKFRGAPAHEIVYGPRFDKMTVAYFAEMNQHPPLGAREGLPGAMSYVRKIEKDGSETDLPPIGVTELEPGEWIRGAESGGGGLGDPHERDRERVRRDLEEGWVTPEAAASVYGYRGE
ncbi:hydantoinase B/oxoprolinase family protein [Hyphococcus luteus]|uniref:hydantoinase B/oxoprolinase family protein n=1 Tax=Hyphococcus luteus TaxID=2058213 RepID=UPI0013FD21EE|nr:hydantoinase B/oxoprolinase family protein [Marinicaulis flavus]